jgi:hypothetical protein
MDGVCHSVMSHSMVASIVMGDALVGIRVDHGMVRVDHGMVRVDHGMVDHGIQVYVLRSAARSLCFSSTGFFPADR